ncbi:hypothetical protein L226DRAFT_540144 [Lentinus tigrinus ALCF2SS1-7]|uniref:uncharacterized protein n=1 Tax=Lentinus tigrinus ALCF2SS1-7 TaxID=1328758 RepID=UPI001165EBCE|nr:hypothetical protein L226DRAFT_540144 [Lentinus tigrinus ALCF2SS1-7]
MSGTQPSISHGRLASASQTASCSVHMLCLATTCSHASYTTSSATASTTSTHIRFSPVQPSLCQPPVDFGNDRTPLPGVRYPNGSGFHSRSRLARLCSRSTTQTPTTAPLEPRAYDNV